MCITYESSSRLIYGARNQFTQPINNLPGNIGIMYRYVCHNIKDAPKQPTSEY